MGTLQVTLSWSSRRVGCARWRVLPIRSLGSGAMSSRWSASRWTGPRPARSSSSSKGAFAAPVLVAGQAVAVSLSVGFAVADTSGSSADQLIAAADEAMFRHKQGRPRSTGVEPS